MAIALDAVSSKGANALPTLWWAHTCSGADRILLVGSGTDAVATVESVTYNGVALTRIGTATSGSDSQGAHTELWYLVAPALGTHNIVVTYSISTQGTAGAASYTGVDQSTPLGSTATATGDDATATVDVSSAAGELVVDAAANFNRTFSVGASQTQRWNQAWGGARSAGSEEAGAATVTMSWTLSGVAKWATIGVPLKPGTGGGGAGETTLEEVWVIPSRTEPFAIADGYAGELARGLASIFPHLLAWKLEGVRFIWHDLGPLPAHAQLEALAAADVPLGSGVDAGLTLFGVEAHDGVVLT